jgi:FkbM family methyltransferase
MDTIKTSSGRLVPINPDKDADVSRHLNDPTGCAECIITQINSEGLYDEYLKNKSDLVILDIGANVGFFSMYAQDSARRVISVEPTPSHQSIFEKITKSATNIELVKAALSDTDAPITFYISDTNSTTNCIVNEMNKYTKSVDVQGVCLNSLLEQNNIDHVDFCKIDIEGSEMKAITVDTLRPVFDKIDSIFIECHSNLPYYVREDIIKNRNTIESALKTVGYTTKVLNYDTIYAYKV